MKISLLIAFWLLCCGNTFFSQNTNYAGLFPTLDLSAELTKKWSYNVYVFDAIKPYTHAIENTNDEARSLYFYAEAGLSYALTKRLSVTASYVYERQSPFRDNYRNENRAFQQLTYKLPIGKSELKQRLRFDERFIQDRGLNRTVFSTRLRYLLGVKMPIRDRIYFMAYSEAFLNTTQGAKYIFNENWSAAQLGFNISEHSTIETGPLYVGWIQNDNKDWFNQYYLQITWVTHFDLGKKSKPVAKD